ncbi:hypothetical protein R6Q57_016728 [Mikania cordata]
MSNSHEKEVEQYHSQPTKNSLNWVPNKWRRLSLKHAALSSGVPKTSRDDASNIPKDGDSNVPMDDTSKVHMEDAPVNNKSRSLSKDAIEFYDNADAPFCYSRILGLNKLHTEFWGVLLGYLNDVSYWRRVIHGPYKPQEKGYLKTGHTNDDYLLKNGGGLG